MTDFPIPSLQRMVQALQSLPGIGPRTAQRLAFYLLKLPAAEVRRLTDDLLHAREAIRFCRRCYGLAEAEECAICRDPRRESGRLCVVADPVDVFALERTGVYRGRYHVLHGTLAPLQGVGPEQLKIKELMKRLKEEPIEEVILAINPTVEGEATAIYLARLLKPLPVKTTRLAPGIPMGADLEYLDELTLTRALQSRIEA